MKNGNIVITDHAAIRYLERVHNLDIKKIIKEEIEEIESLSKMINILGTGTFPIKENFRAVIKKNIVKTIVS